MSGSDDTECEPIVIDNGSWMCKAGFAGDKTARAYEHTVMGRGTEDATTCEYVGENAIQKREGLHLVNLMERGEVKLWDDMERFWDHVFKQELRTSPKGKPVLITEVPFNDKQHRQKLVEIFMERFDVGALYITDTASLALFSSGRTSGIVLDFGGEVTHISALIHGTQIQIHNPSRRMDFGGNDVTRYLVNELEKQGVLLSPSSHRYDVDIYKHHLSSSAYHTNPEDTFTLPSGVSFKVDQKHASCITDTLFDPSLAGNCTTGADELLYNVISACEPFHRSNLTENIIISGGGSMCSDIEGKMKHNLKARGIGSDVKIVAPPERRKSSWLGGSIIASLDEFPTKMCKSRGHYQEYGWGEFQSFNDSELMKRS